MEEALSLMKITGAEALRWLERAIQNSIALNDRMTVEEQQMDMLRLAVDVRAAQLKVTSMLATFDQAGKQRATAFMQHVWTKKALERAEDPRAAVFVRSVLQAAWLRISAERLEAARSKSAGER